MAAVAVAMAAGASEPLSYFGVDFKKYSAQWVTNTLERRGHRLHDDLSELSDGLTKKEKRYDLLNHFQRGLTKNRHPSCPRRVGYLV